MPRPRLPANPFRYFNSSPEVTRHWDIAKLTRNFLELVAERVPDASFIPLLNASDKASHDAWQWGRQLADVLGETGVSLSPKDLMSVLRPLQPRFYSIASSPFAQPDEVQLTVSTIRYEGHGKRRKGVCSAFMADHPRSQAHALPIKALT